MSDLTDFQRAVQIVRDLPPAQIANEDKLNFYALYKQATSGKNTTAKPGFWDVVGKAKWDQWSLLGDLSQDDAMAKYVQATIQCVQRLPNVDHALLLQDLPSSMGSPTSPSLRASGVSVVQSPPPPTSVKFGATSADQVDANPIETLYRNVSSAESMATVGVLLDSDMQEHELPPLTASLAARIEQVALRLGRVEEVLARSSIRPQPWWYTAWQSIEHATSQRAWQWLSTLLALFWMMQNRWLFKWLLQRFTSRRP